jgi:hypothetical protein
VLLNGAEIIPFKPDPDNAGVGKTDIKKALIEKEGFFLYRTGGTPQANGRFYDEKVFSGIVGCFIVIF